MLTPAWLCGAQAIEAQRAMLDELASRATSNLLFHRVRAHLLYARAFSGPDFAEKRGRHLLGAKSVLCEPTWLVVRGDDRTHGALPLFRFSVTLRGRAEPITLLSTGPDSFFFPFRDAIVDEACPTQVLSTMAAALAEKALGEGIIVHLGGIPGESVARSHWHAPLSDCVSGDVRVHASDTLIRGGFFPWNMGAFGRALQAIAATLSGSLAARAEALRADTGAEGSLLSALPGKRERLAATWDELAGELRRVGVPAPLLAAADDALRDRPVGYPHRTLVPATSPFSPSVRTYFKRYGRRFRADGGSFEQLRGTQVEPRDVDDYLDLHAERWGQESAALGGNCAEFHRGLVLEMAREGATNLVFAERGGQRLAAVLCFDLGQRRLYYYAGRRRAPEASRASKLALWEALHDAEERGLSDFDLGYGELKYKLDLASGVRRAQTFLLTRADATLDWDGLFPGYERVVPRALEPKK